MPQNVIDVSQWNGTVDWEAVKAAGYHAIIRCGFGSDYESQDDPQWERNASECERLGIPYGVYIYSYAKNDDMARSEAAHVLRLIAGRKLSYPIYYDVEEPGLEWCARRCAEVFGDEIEAAGHWCGVYSSTSWWQNYLYGLERFTKWVAHWGVDAPGVAGDMWQFTSNGSVPGVYGRCDVSECYRDFPGIIAGGGASPEPAPEPDVESLALRTIAGEFGNGEDRRRALGGNYGAVQYRVNEYYAVAELVIEGACGNGEERKRGLASAGYDYATVQKIVNEII